MHSLGQTRSASQPSHLLQTPDTFVRTPLPGLTGGMAIVHAAPQMGAGFAMMTVDFEPVGTLLHGPGQRLVYVLEGEFQLSEPSTLRPQALHPGSFAYLPADHAHTLRAQGSARLLVIDKAYVPLDAPYIPPRSATVPRCFIGTEQDIASVALNGDPDLQVRSLLPPGLAFDFAVNTMTYAPGASLSQVEMHYMEHGLLMLQGGGIYRLGDAWYPVQAGDFIWMAPFCPQWFAAIGKQPAKYLIYKDFNRHVMA